MPKKQPEAMAKRTRSPSGSDSDHGSDPWSESVERCLQHSSKRPREAAPPAGEDSLSSSEDDGRVSPSPAQSISQEASQGSSRGRKSSSNFNEEVLRILI